MRYKKLWLNSKRTRFCIVKLFNTKREMQEAYLKADPENNSHHLKTLGVHIPIRIFDVKGNEEIKGKTGNILMSVENCGAGIVSHEIGHAVLLAWNLKNKKAYPITIKSMKDEEEILHALTYAVADFYRWFYKVYIIRKGVNKLST